MLWASGLTLLFLVGAACTATPPPAAVTPGPTTAAPRAGPALTGTAGAVTPAPTSLPTLVALSPPASVRVALEGTISDASYWLAVERGYFAKQGIEPAFVRVASATETLAALRAGQADVGGIDLDAATLAALAEGTPLRLVADKGSTAPGRAGATLVVRTDLYTSGAVRDLAGLVDRTIALPPPPDATPLAVALWRGLRVLGVTDQDVNVAYLPPGAVPEALAGAAVDAALLAEPHVALAVERGLAVRLLGADQLYPEQQLSVLAYAEPFARGRAVAARRFLVAYLQGVRDYVSAVEHGVDRSTVLDLLARNAVQPDRAVWDQLTWPYLNPNGHLQLTNALADQDWYVARGTLRQAADLRAAVDPSFLAYALSVVGPYRPPR